MYEALGFIFSLGCAMGLVGFLRGRIPLIRRNDRRLAIWIFGFSIAGLSAVRVLMAAAR